MKTTIKNKAISFAIDGASRRSLVYYILVNNGRLTIEDYEQFLQDFNTKWRGYYSDGFQQWEQEGLITRNKGIYKATELGKAYVNNPKILGEILKMKKKQDDKRTEMLLNFRELERRYHRLINNLDTLIINA